MLCDNTDIMKLRLIMFFSIFKNGKEHKSLSEKNGSEGEQQSMNALAGNFITPHID